MVHEQIQVERRGSVEVITLNRPERMNAWTRRMMGELVDAIENANENDGVGAIVLTGRGRGFCAGADIEDTFKARGGRDAAEAAQDDASDVSAGWVERVRGSKPIVAAVNGPAVGVGLTLILPFDVIVASEHARLGAAFVKMGLVPELASSHFLVQRMGFGAASELCLSGRLLEAAEAHRRGLVDHCVSHEEVLDEAVRIAESFASNPAPQLRMIKNLLTQNGSETDLNAVQRREIEYLKACYESPEHKHAVQAFVEKHSGRSQR